MKKIKSALLWSSGVLIIVVCITMTLAAQSAAQKDSDVKAPAAGKDDHFEDAHRGLYTSQPDKGQDAGRLTDEVAKALPASTAAGGNIERRNFIDEHVFGRIEKDGIPHANLSSDAEFVRRVYLDAQGLLPTSETVRAFVGDKDPNKRDKLIDTLIGTEEFSEQWAWFWGDLFRLMGYAGDAKHAFQFWNKEWLKVDRPYNDVVTDLLTGVARGHAAIPQLGFLGRIVRNSGLKNRDLTDPYNYANTTNRLDAIDEMAVETGRIFLGINIECISCHDGAGHLESVNLYLSERTRSDFAQQSAFNGRLRLIGEYNVENEDTIMDDLAKGYDTGNDAPWFTESENRFPRTGETFEPAFILTGEKPRPGANQRAELARMVTSSMQFNRATANLIWGKLMTVGFVEPYDGFDLARIDPKNPPPKPWTIQPNNPELLEALAADFQANHYSIQHLMKTIMKSNAYQLSSQFPAVWKDAYAPYYARKYVRVMTGPEVIDTVAQASGREYNFPYLGTVAHRVKQLTELGDISKRKGDTTGADVTSIMNSFFENNRTAQTPTGNKATVLQAILMMSSGLVNDRASAAEGGIVKRLLDSGTNDEGIIEELYLASVSRWPTGQEKQYLLAEFQKDRQKGAEDLEWTLLNSPEFLLNH